LATKARKRGIAPTRVVSFPALLLAATLWAAPFARAAAGDCERARVFEGGAARQWLCVEDARSLGLTIVNLGDDWLPRVLQQPPRAPAELRQPYRSTYLALSNERPEELGQRQRFETRLKLFGIMPSFHVVRTRLSDIERHRCDEAIDDTQLRALGRTLSPWQPDLATQRRRAQRVRQDRALLERTQSRLGLDGLAQLEALPAYQFVVRRYRRDVVVVGAIEAMQAHLVCADLLQRHERGVFDESTAQALRLWQRGQMLVSFGVLDAPTRASFLESSREMVFRTALRALRERVVDALSLIEDGSASGRFGRVLGRELDPPEMLAMTGREALEGATPDLVSPATEAAARQLGWDGPDGLASFFEQHDQANTAGLRVALRLPAPPSYHGPHMELAAEVDRGDVYYAYPYSRTGKHRSQPVQRRPTLILYATVDGRRTPLMRWNTTIGGFQPEQTPAGALGLRYKPSPVGPRVWRDLLAAPAWLPPPSTPDRELVRRVAGGRYPARQDIVGPGYRSAYGLAMLVHLKPLTASRAGDASGDVRMFDEGVRTHGSVSYGSILRGHSHGCHRLFNHLALRLMGFLLAHRQHVRHANLAVQYSRRVHAHGTHELRANTRGYHYELVPPVAVEVLEGNVRGLPRTPITGLRPLPEELVEAARRAAEGDIGAPASAGSRP
jgi:hypothetical protein